MCSVSWQQAVALASTTAKFVDKGGRTIDQKKDLKDAISLAYTCELETKNALYMHEKQLLLLPSALFDPYFCQNLVYLELSRNRLQVLPPSIGKLTHLRSLLLDRNLLGFVCFSFVLLAS